ncbi:hypothetical protein RI054_14g70400 [Pseudoscourfieldia marina]
MSSSPTSSANSLSSSSTAANHTTTTEANPEHQQQRNHVSSRKGSNNVLFVRGTKTYSVRGLPMTGQSAQQHKGGSGGGGTTTTKSQMKATTTSRVPPSEKHGNEKSSMDSNAGGGGFDEIEAAGGVTHNKANRTREFIRGGAVRVPDPQRVAPTVPTSKKIKSSSYRADDDEEKTKLARPQPPNRSAPHQPPSKVYNDSSGTLLESESSSHVVAATAAFFEQRGATTKATTATDLKYHHSQQWRSTNLHEQQQQQQQQDFNHHRNSSMRASERYGGMLSGAATPGGAVLRASWTAGGGPHQHPSAFRTPAPTRYGPSIAPGRLGSSSVYPFARATRQTSQQGRDDDSIHQSVMHLSQDMDVMRESLDAALAATNARNRSYATMRRSANWARTSASALPVPYPSSDIFGDGGVTSTYHTARETEEVELVKNVDIIADNETTALPRWCRWIAERINRFALSRETSAGDTDDDAFTFVSSLPTPRPGDDEDNVLLRSALVEILRALNVGLATEGATAFQVNTTTTTTTINATTSMGGADLSPATMNEHSAMSSPTQAETLSSWAEQDAFQRNLALVQQLEQLQTTLDTKDEQVRTLQDAMWKGAAGGGEEERVLRSALEAAEQESARLRIALDAEKNRSDVLREGLASITDRIGEDTPRDVPSGNGTVLAPSDWARQVLADDAVCATLEASVATLETIAETENPIRAQIAFLNETIEDAAREIASLRSELAATRAKVAAAEAGEEVKSVAT